MNILNWIYQNKEWIFSGIGITVLTILATLLFKKKDKKSSKNSIEQLNQGDNSTQIGIQNNYYSKEDKNE